MKQISIPGLANHDVAVIIFNTTHDSMFIMQVEPDDQFRCIEVNKAYLHNTRLKPEQVVGKTLKEVLPEKAYLTAYNGYKKAIETRQSVQYQEKVDFGFGEDIVETTITPVFDASGTCTHLIGASKDVKLQKQSEKAQKRRLDFLSASTTTMLHLPNVDAIYNYINQTIHQHFPETIVVTSIVNESSKTTTLSGFTGGQANLLEKLKKLTGLSLKGKVFNLLTENEKIYRTGNFVEFAGGLPELVSSELPALVSQTIQIIAGIHKVYAIGMNYDEKLLAILHVFTLNKSEISDSGFIETFLKQAGIVVQRKLLEEQLRFHSMILDQIQDRVTVTDLQGNITYVNKAVEQMLNIKSEDFIGKSVKSYGDNPEKGATQQIIIDKTLENGAWSGEIVNLAPDGTEHFLNVRTRILKNLNGEPIGMCGISTDITEQKKHEEIIKESENRYQTLFDNMADGFSLNRIITDDNGRPTDWKFLLVNPAHEKQTGLKREETIGKTIREIFPDIEQEWIDFYGQVALSGKSGKKISFNQNTGKYYEVNAFCPSPGNFAVVVNNITERIMAEKQLIQAKEKAEEDETKIRSMFENTLTGIMFATPEGKILEANPAMLKIVGSPSLEVSKQLNLLDHESLKQIGFADNLKKCIRQKTVISAETQYTSRFGKITYLKYYLIPIFVNEKNLGVWVNVHDLTDLWSVRNDLIVAKEKAEAADRLKTAFLNNISHEVRTPLNGILGFGELITQPGLSPQKKEEYLNTLNYSSNRLMQTITDYMDISLLTSGNQEVFIETVVPADLINGCFRDFYEKCTDKNLKLITSLPEDAEKDIILSDKNLLIKSLSHLIENAIKFSNQGDIIIGYRRNEEGLDFFVSDKGIGISKAMCNRVFDNFIQEDLSTTRGHEGSGLGLSIVREIAHLLKGTIQVESEKGQGSTFTLSIQQKMIHNLPINKPVDTRPIVTTEFVLLIVEDDQSIFDFFDAIFNRYQLTIFKAYNGEEAIVLCKEHPEIDLILMDLKMPVMNGFEATRIIKQIRPDLPVIAQTAYALSGDEHRAIQAGCDDYITKPFGRKHLIEKMKKFGFDEEKLLKE